MLAIPAGDPGRGTPGIAATPGGSAGDTQRPARMLAIPVILARHPSARRLPWRQRR